MTSDVVNSNGFATFIIYVKVKKTSCKLSATLDQLEKPQLNAEPTTLLLTNSFPFWSAFQLSNHQASVSTRYAVSGDGAASVNKQEARRF